jgi:hypothetical protein
MSRAQSSQQQDVKDRPRTGANQNRAGSPITQERVREVYSMTDAVQGGTGWVPRLGVEVSPERAELVRGLFKLAAWVVDHPELPLPWVQATVFPRHAVQYDEDPTDEGLRGVVARVAAALGVSAEFTAGGTHYTADGGFGPIRVYSTAITAEHMAAYTEHMATFHVAQASDQPAEQVAVGDAR